jgi:hypothetical protein
MGHHPGAKIRVANPEKDRGDEKRRPIGESGCQTKGEKWDQDVRAKPTETQPKQGLTKHERKRERESRRQTATSRADGQTANDVHGHHR